MGFHVVSNDCSRELMRRLIDDNYLVYILDGRSITDEESLFSYSMRAIPMGDALPKELCQAPHEKWRFPRNWNAYEDFLYQGLTTQESNRIVIFWTDFCGLMYRDASLAEFAKTVFKDMIRAVAQRGSFGDDGKVHLHVFAIVDRGSVEGSSNEPEMIVEC